MNDDDGAVVPDLVGRGSETVVKVTKFAALVGVLPPITLPPADEVDDAPAVLVAFGIASPLVTELLELAPVCELPMLAPEALALDPANVSPEEMPYENDEELAVEANVAADPIVGLAVARAALVLVPTNP